MPATNDSSLAPAIDTETAPVLDAKKASRSLRRGLISLAILVALAGGLILAVPGLHGVGHTLAHMQLGWIAAAIALEILSCLGYVLAFLQVFETAPLRFGGRVALTELAFGTAVSLGGAGSVAVGAWLLIERGAPPARVAERSAVLFLITSAVNVITMTLVGLALYVGILPGPHNPLLSAVPAAVGITVLAFFLALPRLSELGAAHRAPGRIQRLLNDHGRERPRHQRPTAQTRLADRGRVRLPVVRHRRTRSVLRRDRPQPADRCDRARLPDRVPVQPDPDPRRHRRAGRQHDRDAGALRSRRYARGRGDTRLPRDRALDPGDVGHGRFRRPTPHQAPAADPATPASRASPTAR